MTLTNTLKDRIQIQLRNATLTSTGETVVWTPVETKFARVIPLSVRARAFYQALHSEATHQIVLRGAVSLNLGSNRFKWGDKTLEPVEPPKLVKNTTLIAVKEV